MRTTYSSPLTLHSVRTRPADQQCCELEKSSGLWKMQSTSATAKVSVFMMHDVSSSDSTDDYPVQDTVTAGTPDTRSTCDAMKASHQLSVAQNHHLLQDLLAQPTRTCCPDDIVFDPIRPCRHARGAPPPPPRRFYAFWWRGIARVAYDAERAARLQRARAGASV
jgi:hypothetical protein